MSPQKPNVFKTELDATGLYFENNYDNKSKRKFSYSPHFSFEYQVAAYSSAMKYQLKGTPIEEKCLNILHSYLEDANQSSGVVEFFTSWSGKEELG